MSKHRFSPVTPNISALQRQRLIRAIIETRQEKLTPPEKNSEPLPLEVFLSGRKNQRNKLQQQKTSSL
ncbi:hypothetical protein H5S87_28090 [Escherichia coli]|nr:hypothetical protein [Escherichia coli]